MTPSDHRLSVPLDRTEYSGTHEAQPCPPIYKLSNLGEVPQWPFSVWIPQLCLLRSCSSASSLSFPDLPLPRNSFRKLPACSLPLTGTRCSSDPAKVVTFATYTITTAHPSSPCVSDSRSTLLSFFASISAVLSVIPLDAALLGSCPRQLPP